MMLRCVALRKAQAVVIGLALVFSAGSSASAQYSIGGSGFNDPHIMCKAWVRGTYTQMASGEAPNEFLSMERFKYWAMKYGKETGQDLTYDCERFEDITPEYRQVWEPGGSYVGSGGDTYSLTQATFLPENWSTTPTPEEVERVAAEKKSKKAEPKKEKSDTVSAEPPKKSAAEVAADEAAKRRAEREAAFQAKQDEYERLLADRERKVQEFNELKAKMEAQQKANLAAADAAAAAYKKEQDKYADIVRQHEDDVARYQAQVGGKSTAGPVTGTPGRFQVTGAIVDTRDAAMAALMRDPRSARITDIRCDQVTMFTPPKWTCWGFVTDTVTPQQGSAQ